MGEYGYNRSPHDNCVYHRRVKDGSFIYLLLYVDDMIIAFWDMIDIQKLKVFLSSEFDMKDLGVAHKIFEIEIHRDRKHWKFFLSRKSYIQKVLERFSMLDEKIVSTPLAAHFRLLGDLDRNIIRVYVSTPIFQCRWEFDVRYDVH